MKHFGFNISIYRGYKKPTMLVASVGKCGHEGYREVQIWWNGKLGLYEYITTDGYKWLSIIKTHTSIKSILNILESRFKMDRVA